MVFGEIDAGPDVARIGGWLHIRTFPDHEDGFDIRRVYTGDDDLSDAIAEGNVEYPFEYELQGPVDPLGARFRILAWRSQDPDATWVAPGEPYGHTTFSFIGQESGGPYVGEQVDFAIYTIGPPP